ncbi:NADH-ubiquinone oxido 14.8 kDa subunit [Cyphellophora attinorum]|uniref:NADH-ubiquinone oxido 14.8 kDa subunit n=1 Tax=Cyphellophora attinorum TaxID=1664694 RepID=A0A0N1NVT5_9EURO|nr:NADH-ubiquinone oxido 14.8 kDa subunit [Phialophora attinorum]KPI34402.1 NADH-ubiquinone oxido 14.8 kDa subunit [Phialophora attinorum]
MEDEKDEEVMQGLTIRAAINWGDAHRRVLKSYREWLRAGPEIQQMYSLNMPVARIRSKVREEFEKHRYVNNLKAVDVLISQSHMEFQETLNFWKQLSHVMKYFRKEEDPTARLPKNFMSGFLEVSHQPLRFSLLLEAMPNLSRKGPKLDP